MSPVDPLVIWGASGWALVVADIVRLQGNYEIIGFLDDIHAERKGEAFADSRVLGGSPGFWLAGAGDQRTV